VGIPALVVLAWVLMLVIDLLGKVIRRVVSSDSTVTG